jgi:hypothetical protein
MALLEDWACKSDRLKVIKLALLEENTEIL